MTHYDYHIERLICNLKAGNCSHPLPQRYIIPFLHYFLQKASESVVKVKPKNREVLLGNGFEKLQTVSNQISESTLALQRLQDLQK